MVDTGKKIKELRIRAGLTQKELGAILSVSYQAVS
ncbi:MAG: helix-turn-helix transcriptional regulator, partial [Clostridia bacterium]|nr:helix-turn-helix transcriptional regulator [Clostridia bacterium]